MPGDADDMQELLEALRGVQKQRDELAIHVQARASGTVSHFLASSPQGGTHQCQVRLMEVRKQGTLRAHGTGGASRGCWCRLGQAVIYCTSFTH